MCSRTSGYGGAGPSSSAIPPVCTPRPYRVRFVADQHSRAVLITGCSSGIGRATAEHLASRGWTVYATARKVEAISDLESAGCTLLALDVTHEDSMRAAVERVEADHGAVGV